MKCATCKTDVNMFFDSTGNMGFGDLETVDPSKKYYCHTCFLGLEKDTNLLFSVTPDGEPVFKFSIAKTIVMLKQQGLEKFVPWVIMADKYRTLKNEKIGIGDIHPNNYFCEVHGKMASVMGLVVDGVVRVYCVHCFFEGHDVKPPDLPELRLICETCGNHDGKGRVTVHCDEPGCLAFHTKPCPECNPDATEQP